MSDIFSTSKDFAALLTIIDRIKISPIVGISRSLFFVLNRSFFKRWDAWWGNLSKFATISSSGLTLTEINLPPKRSNKISPGILFIKPPSTRRDFPFITGNKIPGKAAVALVASQIGPRSSTASSEVEIFTAQVKRGNHKSSIYLFLDNIFASSMTLFVAIIELYGKVYSLKALFEYDIFNNSNDSLIGFVSYLSEDKKLVYVDAVTSAELFESLKNYVYNETFQELSLADSNLVIRLNNDLNKATIEVPPSFVNNEPIVFSTEYILERRELLIIQSSNVNSSFLENNLWTPLFILKNKVQN